VKKTNAARILDKLGISYEMIEYNVDENDLSATHVAETLGENPQVVFKTLVAKGEKNGIGVFIIPATYELNLKAAAQAMSDKKVTMIQVKELLPLTGYIRGGCSPIGMKKNFPTYLHESANLFSKIYISAGIRGMQLMLSPNDLIRATNAMVCSIAE
jgi:ybaK/ebsC protein